MASPTDKIISGLPDTLRNSNRPIVIYQGGPPPLVDTPTRSALSVMFWLALMTLCLGVAAGFAWQLWNPGFDRTAFSPIYAEGRPLGLMKRLEERRQVNLWAEHLTDFRDQMRGANAASRLSTAALPLLTNRQSLEMDDQGIDALRAQWDEMCQDIRTRIYERRIGALDMRAFSLRQRRARETDANVRAQLDAGLQQIAQQRGAQVELRRTDADPALRCVPAAFSDSCSETDKSPWCNPQLSRPEEFVDEEQVAPQ